MYRPSASSAIAGFKDRLASEREFMAKMNDVAMNQNPFGPVALYTREGIHAQLQFREQFQQWRKNHERLEVDKEMLKGLENIYEFEANDAISAIGKSARQVRRRLLGVRRRSTASGSSRAWSSTWRSTSSATTSVCATTSTAAWMR